MNHIRFFLSALLCFSVCLVGLAQEESGWDFMTNREMGVDRLRAEHPELTGKGVVIAILDTGVDMGVEGLKTLPNGEVKVVDVRDFTGEGNLLWEEVRIVPEDKVGEKLVDSQGRVLINFRKALEGAEPQRFCMAFIQESRFIDSDVKDLNSDGDTKDTFGILIFLVRTKAAEEGSQGEIRYEALVDLNGDGNLEDGVRLTDYWREHETFVLKGKEGARRQLTMALNFYPEENRLSVHFDNGGHGTHVAGIAAGYRVHGQEGYDGMAPGAKVISLKIGNNRFSGSATVTESVKKALEYGVAYHKRHKVPLIFNMSYGIGSEREGLSAVDKYIDEMLWKNPGVLFVTSAGNSGPGLSSVGTPAAGGRAISVGALLAPQAAAAQYGYQLNEEVPFGFSSRGGDTFKPDIVAPGSASSTVPLWGNRDHMSGTSMASPAAAGAIALLVDGLLHDPRCEVDNLIIHRAIKNTGRQLQACTVLDEGGGVLDLPAAYEYAQFLCKTNEHKLLREYRIENQGPAEGIGLAYWRASPFLPKSTNPMEFKIEAGFHEKSSEEERARFYRAFQLHPDVEWLSLTRPSLYLKGDVAATVGVMAQLEGAPPGLYTGKVVATRKSPEKLSGAPIHEFDLVVSVIVPHRTTPENRGRIYATGSVKPGYFDRVFVEVPPGTTAITSTLRLLGTEGASSVEAHIYDPEGARRGRVDTVTEDNRTRTHSTTRDLVPGTWEIVVSSPIGSRASADYDLDIMLSGVTIEEPLLLRAGNDPVRDRMLLDVLCTQARPFRGTVAGELTGMVRKEVIEVADGDTYLHTVQLDHQTRKARWTIDFDRDTFALFTDCILRVEEAATGKVLVNAVLGHRSESAEIEVPKEQSEPVEYKVVLMPAFFSSEDATSWRFILTEELSWAPGPLKLEPLRPKEGKVHLLPWERARLEFRFPPNLPAVPEAYELNAHFEATDEASKAPIGARAFAIKRQ